MTRYLVTGIYWETLERFADFFEAETPTQAEEMAEAMTKHANDEPQLIIACVLELTGSGDPVIAA